MSNTLLKLRRLHVVKYRYDLMMDTSGRGSGTSELASIKASIKHSENHERSDHGGG
jgi:hypothetical protein